MDAAQRFLVGPALLGGMQTEQPFLLAWIVLGRQQNHSCDHKEHQGTGPRLVKRIQELSMTHTWPGTEEVLVSDYHLFKCQERKAKKDQLPRTNPEPPRKALKPFTNILLLFSPAS